MVRSASPAAVAVLAALTLGACGMQPGSGGAPAGSSAPHLAVMNDQSHGWALTSGGVARTSDGGQTWTNLKGVPDINYSWGTVASFPSADAAWVCEQGRARGSQPSTSGDTRTFTTPPARCVASADGGRTWTQHDVPGSGTKGFGRTRDDSTIDDILGVSGAEAWLMVGTLDTFAGGGQERIGLIELRLLHTVDAGAHWSVVRDQKVDVGTAWPGGAASWIDVGPSGTLYTSGFSKGIDRSTDGGASWTTLHVPLPTAGQAGTQAYCGLTQKGEQLTVTTRAYVQNNATMFDEVSTDGGTTWSAPVVAPSGPGPSSDPC